MVAILDIVTSLTLKSPYTTAKAPHVLLFLYAFQLFLSHFIRGRLLVSCVPMHEQEKTTRKGKVRNAVII